MSHSEPGAWSVAWDERDQPLVWRALDVIVPAFGFFMALWVICSELGLPFALGFTAAIAGFALASYLLRRENRSGGLTDDSEGQWHVSPVGLVYRASRVAKDQPYQIERVVRHLGGVVVWLKRAEPLLNGSASVRTFVWRGAMTTDDYRRLSVLLRWHSGGRA